MVVVFSIVPITLEFAEAVERLVLQLSALPVVNRLLLAVVRPVVGNTEELALLKGDKDTVTVVVLLLWRVTTDVLLRGPVVSEGVGYTVMVTTSVEMLTPGVSATVVLASDFIVLRLPVDVGTGCRVLRISVLENGFVALLLTGYVESAVRVASVSRDSVSGCSLRVTVKF